MNHGLQTQNLRHLQLTRATRDTRTHDLHHFTMPGCEKGPERSSDLRDFPPTPFLDRAPTPHRELGPMRTSAYDPEKAQESYLSEQVRAPGTANGPYHNQSPGPGPFERIRLTIQLT